MRARRLLRPAMAGLAMTVGVFSFAMTVAAEDLSSLQAAFLRGDYNGVVREAHRLNGQRGSLTDGVLYLWGISALKLDNAEEGRQALGRLIAEHSDSQWRAQALLALGQSWEEAGQDDEALKSYKALLENAGSYFPQAALKLGRVQMRLGLWQESRSTLNSLVQRAPQSPEAAAARDLLGQGSFYYCVQVGAFSAEPNAERLANELKRRGYSPEISKATLEGNPISRVRLGRFNSRQEAEGELKRLREDGFPGRIFP